MPVAKGHALSKQIQRTGKGQIGERTRICHKVFLPWVICCDGKREERRRCRLGSTKWIRATHRQNADTWRKPLCRRPGCSSA